MKSKVINMRSVIVLVLVLLGSARSIVPVQATELLDADAVWRPEVEELYWANVYSTRSEASRQLARQLAIDRKASPGGEPFCFEETNALTQQLAAEMKSAGLLVSDAGRPIRVSVETRDARSVLCLETRLGDKPISLQAAFTDKPWAGSVVPPLADFVVARGLAESTSADTAVRRALETHLLPLVCKQLGTSPSGWRRRVALRRMRHEMEHSPMIADRFQQTFYKTMDEERHEAFSREAILLDVSDDTLTRLVRHVRRDLHHGQRVRSGAFGLAAVIVSVTSSVCWILSTFFNRRTQGYYIWPIRLTTAVLLLLSFGVAAGITFSILKAI